MFVTFWIGSVLLLIHHMANEQMTIYPESWWNHGAVLGWSWWSGVALLATLWLLVF
jgi:hypothetical protein